MPRRANSFARALREAENRLARARAERVAAQTKLLSLDMEIPRLERTIGALHGQVNPADTPLAILKAEPDQYRTPPANMTPEELARWYTERDLSGVGSIVPEKPATPTVVDEDSLLPEDFAEGKKEK